MRITDKLKDLFSSLKKSFRLFFDKSIPVYYKIIPFLGVLYVLFPFDFVIDIIPFIGQLDDLAIISGALGIFVKLSERHKRSK